MILVPGGSAWAAAASAADSNSAAPASSAAPADDTKSDNLGDIVVTARKRSESVLNVPVAMSAMSKRDLDKLNVKTIEDLVQVSPGVVVNNATTGAARSDRSRTAIIIRGMAPTVGNQTSSIFVNGAPVADGATTAIFDLERTEVLKGPQSAYFGRQTFGGAINFITAEPTNDWRGYFSSTGGSGNYYDVNGAVGGPIIKDLLSFRASARYFSRDGTWKNEAEPGHTLGDQETKSGSMMLKFTPSSNLTVKLFAALANDDDGPGATAVLEPEQANCTLGSGAKYFCGTLPGILPGQPSARTNITQGIADLQQNYTSLLDKDQENTQFGLKRETRHYQIAADYALPGGQTISSLTAWNSNEFSVLYQLNGRASPYAAVNTGYPYLPYTDWPTSIERAQRDFSQEVRIASKAGQRLRWMFGGSYLSQSGHERFAQLYYLIGQYGGDSGLSQSKTLGGFGSLSYDLTPKLTLNAEARYQSDKLISRDGLTGAIGYQVTYTSFMPRATVQYKPTSDTMVYATYSKGVNPGLSRDPLLSVPEVDRPALEALGIKHGVKPEKLENYELGFKGKLFNGHLVLSGDVYYDIWSDKITEQTIIIPSAGGIPFTVNLYTNLGKVTLKGAELEMTATPFDHVSVHLSGAFTDSKINRGACSICLTQSGSDVATGNQLGLISKYTAQGSIEYAHPIGYKRLEAFFRPDFFYKSGMYESDGDYAKSTDQFVVNFRAGVRSDKVTLEAFMTNAFNNKAYTSLLPDWELDRPTQTFATYDTLYVGLPYLRTYGLKATYSF